MYHNQHAIGKEIISQKVHTSAPYILNNLAPGQLYPRNYFEQTEIQVFILK